TEAIFLGVYLYGWDRVSQRAHLAAGVVVAFSGMISGVFVVIANSWMNTPVGFRLVDGLPDAIDPIASLTNPAALHETVHMTIAAYAATGFVVAGIHAAMWLRDRGNLFHRRAIAIAFTIGAIAAMMQPISGDASARAVAHLQPLKMAAFEGLFHGGPNAPLALGGIPDVKGRKLLYAIELPSMLSIMTYHNANAVIPGLDSFPEKDWPAPMIAVHFGFQIMVGAGFAMAGLGLWGALLRWWRGTIFDSIWFMRGLVAAAPLGLIAVEAGWVVTEVGRQPWIIYGVMRTADAVTPMPGLTVTFALYTTLYLFLGATVVFLIWRQVMQSPTQAEVAAFSTAGR
ncbi:MAG: cytochrome bd ubiquinol oxidase subunit, partial [Candidatus Binataceae bacterium]|nr:cytochrome bd ubiquinol oxidase subunit [Candidatus Binataceae bacterium]